MSNAQESGPIEIPYQAVVYFIEYPEIDAEELAILIDNLDDEESELAEVEKGEDKQGTGFRMGTLSVTLGTMTADIVLHDRPSPSPWLIEDSSLIDEIKQDLLSHKAFVLISVYGGDDLEGVEKVLLLIKLGMVLTEFGGIGLTLLTNDATYPAGLLQDIMEQETAEESGEGDFASDLSRLADEGNPMAAMMQQFIDAARTDGTLPPLEASDEESTIAYDEEDRAELEEDGEFADEDDGSDEEDDDVSNSVFSAMRMAGEPFELLAALAMIPADYVGVGAPGARVLVSRGFAHCGVPDLMYVAEDPNEDLAPIAEMFRNTFSYMMEQGAIIEPGHAITTENEGEFVFRECPENANFPFGVYNILQVTRG